MRCTIDLILNAPQTGAMGTGLSMKYPRRKGVRRILRGLTGFLIHRFGKLEVEGLENIPETGPVILAPNHFNFVDPPLILYTSPRMVEFIGGAQRPNSPFWAKQIPKWWGFIRAYRGGYGRSTFRQSLDVLKQGAETGLLDLSLLQVDRYEEALRQGISRLWAGDDPQEILDDMAAQWDKLTDRIGVDKQRRVYSDWAKKPNAYPN